MKQPIIKRSTADAVWCERHTIEVEPTYYDDVYTYTSSTHGVSTTHTVDVHFTMEDPYLNHSVTIPVATPPDMVHVVPLKHEYDIVLLWGVYKL